MSIDTATRVQCDRCKYEERMRKDAGLGQVPTGWSKYDNGEHHLCNPCTKARAEMMIAFYSNRPISVEPRVPGG